MPAPLASRTLTAYRGRKQAKHAEAHAEPSVRVWRSGDFADALSRKNEGRWVSSFCCKTKPGALDALCAYEQLRTDPILVTAGTGAGGPSPILEAAACDGATGSRRSAATAAQTRVSGAAAAGMSGAAENTGGTAIAGSHAHARPSGSPISALSRPVLANSPSSFGAGAASGGEHHNPPLPSTILSGGVVPATPKKASVARRRTRKPKQKQESFLVIQNAHWDLFVVFSGFGFAGKECADFMARRFVQYYGNSEQVLPFVPSASAPQHSVVIKHLQRTFSRASTDLTQLSNVDITFSGCTAVALLAVRSSSTDIATSSSATPISKQQAGNDPRSSNSCGGHLYCANLGDCRCVAGFCKEPTPMAAEQDAGGPSTTGADGRDDRKNETCGILAEVGASHELGAGDRSSSYAPSTSPSRTRVSGAPSNAVSFDLAASAVVVPPLTTRSFGGEGARPAPPRDGAVLPIPLSRDHVLTHYSKERRRIEKRHPTVVIKPFKLDSQTACGPPRLWISDDIAAPGMRVSRCFGASVGSQVGVIAEPEITALGGIKRNQVRFAILASRGFFACVSNSQAVDVVSDLLRTESLKRISGGGVSSAGEALPGTTGGGLRASPGMGMGGLRLGGGTNKLSGMAAMAKAAFAVAQKKLNAANNGAGGDPNSAPDNFNHVLPVAAGGNSDDTEGSPDRHPPVGVDATAGGGAFASKPKELSTVGPASTSPSVIASPSPSATSMLQNRWPHAAKATSKLGGGPLSLTSSPSLLPTSARSMLPGSIAVAAGGGAGSSLRAPMMLPFAVRSSVAEKTTLAEKAVDALLNLASAASCAANHGTTAAHLHDMTVVVVFFDEGEAGEV